MSFFTLFFATAGALFSTYPTPAQEIKATIQLDPVPYIATVTGSAATRRTRLSFLKSAIGVPDLSSRVSGVRLFDADGKTVDHKRFDSGEYAADAGFSGWSYSIDLTPAKDQRSAAHASWLTKTEGLLMLDDLVPRFRGGSTQAAVQLEVPSGWRIITTEKANADGTYSVSDIEKAVFIIGTATREIPKKAALSFVTSGTWLFSDPEVAAMGDAIMKEYSSAFGSVPSGEMQIAILPFPQNGVQKGEWEAETRGTTVLIVSSDMPFKTQSLQRLHEQLRHEIFHLWLPNGVELTAVTTGFTRVLLFIVR